MKLENTQDWPLDRVMKYSVQITAAMKKVIARFPEDATLKSMAEGILSGDIQMWIMLDEEEFKGFVLTDITHTQVTNYRSVRIVCLGGIDGVDLCPHIETIEKWAWELGVDSVLPVGRMGWKKPLEKLGYVVDRVVYRKDKPE